MSIAFSRSIRLMQQDSFRTGLVTLALLLVFLIAWMAWFFLARIPLYVTSRQYQVSKAGTLQVEFSIEDQRKILPGQKAILSLPETAGQPAQILQAEVMDISATGRGFVEVYVFSAVDPLPLLRSVAGEVKVEVGAFSPATFVLRSAGQLMGKP